MGTFTSEITVVSADRARAEAVEALVDTGSTYFWLPSPIAERLGYRPVTTRRLATATGEEVERGAAPVLVRLNGETLPVLCVLGDEGSQPLLGAMVLETFSLAVDPVNRKLVPVRALAMPAGGGA